ncbi:MAG: O-antigen ligase family protein [Pseudomonadota bacterium]
MNRWINALLSPSTALVASMLGYYTFATYANVFLPDSNLGGILIRAGLAGLVCVSVILTSNSVLQRRSMHLLPVMIFFSLYGMRLLENIFISGVWVSPGPQTVFPVYFISTILPLVLLSTRLSHFNDNHFHMAMLLLAGLFLAGLGLNLDVLLETSERRMTLEKINPISLAHTAFGFVLYFIVAFGKSRRWSIEAMLIIPLMLAVVLYARSRGAYVTGAIAILIYVMLLRGGRRILVTIGLTGITSLLLIFYSEEIYDIVITRLQQTNIDDDVATYLRYKAFWGSWEQFKDNILIGRYAVEQSVNFYPHNIYMESLMAVGLLGTIPFILHLIFATKAAVSIVRSRQYPVFAVFCAIIFFKDSLSGLFSGNLWGSTTFWVSSTMVIVFWYQARHHTMRPLSQSHHIPSAQTAGLFAPARDTPGR